ncbi:MAG: pentapeptide repeat-containing protein [Bdellovibrionales bacterium]|nr:pentapeptide repeat-containing protein [Bdellovibrionales bacterium]
MRAHVRLLTSALLLSLAACNGSGGSTSTNRNSFTASELSLNGDSAASTSYVYVELSHPQADGDSVVSVNYHFPSTQQHNLCFDPDSAYSHNLLISNENGEVANINSGEPCKSVLIEAGDYSLQFSHSGEGDVSEKVHIFLRPLFETATRNTTPLSQADTNAKADSTCKFIETWSMKSKVVPDDYQGDSNFLTTEYLVASLGSQLGSHGFYQLTSQRTPDAKINKYMMFDLYDCGSGLVKFKTAQGTYLTEHCGFLMDAAKTIDDAQAFQLTYLDNESITLGVPGDPIAYIKVGSVGGQLDEFPLGLCCCQDTQDSLPYVDSSYVYISAELEAVTTFNRVCGSSRNDDCDIEGESSIVAASSPSALETHWIPTRQQGILALIDSCRGCNLEGIDFSGRDLKAIDFSNAHFKGANLSKVDFTNAMLAGADLSGANLTSANLTSANLSKVDLTTTTLTGATMVGINLSGANLSQVHLSGYDISNADFSQSNLTSTDLSHATLDNSNFSTANLKEANLGYASLKDTNFSKATLTETIFSYAFMVNANLSGSDIQGASFEHVDFYSDGTGTASLEDATIVSGNFTDANLIEIVLDKAIISGGNFSDARLLNASIRGTQHPQNSTGETLLFANALLAGADFSGALFDEVDFSNAVISTKSNSVDLIVRVSVDETKTFSYNFEPTILPTTSSSTICPNSSSGPCMNDAWVPNKLPTYGGSDTGDTWQ